MSAKRELSEEELQKRKEWLKKFIILFEIIERWMEKDETKKKENQRGGFIYTGAKQQIRRFMISSVPECMLNREFSVS